MEISTCCRAKPLESFKENPRDHHDPIPIYRCEKCGKECDVEEVCGTCGGTGEVTTQERVYPGEPHMADIGTAQCPDCRQEEDVDVEQD